MTDHDEEYAEALAVRDALNYGEMYWDRGPVCVRIPLVNLDYNDDLAPSLFVFSTGERVTPGLDSTRWRAELGGFDEATAGEEEHEVHFEIFQRTWLGDDASTVARRVDFLVQMLRHGAGSMFASL